MTNVLTPRVIGGVLLAALFAMHVLVLLRVIPAEIVWGGNATENIVAFEVFALATTMLFAVAIAAKAGYLHLSRGRKVVNAVVWMFFVYMLLNTLGNLAARTSTEMLLFTPLTVLLAFLAFRLATAPDLHQHTLRR